ncbi:hypothetical protein KKE45_00335 [Patescibacteria group bacterium]|nr:hypothetical protein [Patescibacteria group bacterium]
MKKCKLGSGYICYVLVCFFLAFGILFVSLTKASWKVLASGKSYDSYRIKPVEVEKVNEEGRRVKVVYKLPEVRTLPGSFFYGFKEIRNWLWLKLAGKPIDKAKLLLFLADKKVSETLLLDEKGKPNLALRSAKDAFEKLKRSKEWSLKLEENEERLLRAQLSDACLTYRQVFGSILKNEKSEYEKLIVELDEWYEKE